MKLTELLQTIKKEKEDGLVDIDSWRWPDVDHLVNMGFEFMDDYRFSTDREPRIVIYKKKDDANSKEEVFIVEPEDRDAKKFRNFSDVIDYFDTYEQPEIDKKK